MIAKASKGWKSDSKDSTLHRRLHLLEMLNLPPATENVHMFYKRAGPHHSRFVNSFWFAHVTTDISIRASYSRLPTFCLSVKLVKKDLIPYISAIWCGVKMEHDAFVNANIHLAHFYVPSTHVIIWIRTINRWQDEILESYGLEEDQKVDPKWFSVTLSRRHFLKSQLAVDCPSGRSKNVQLMNSLYVFLLKYRPIHLCRYDFIRFRLLCSFVRKILEKTSLRHSVKHAKKFTDPFFWFPRPLTARIDLLVFPQKSQTYSSC